VLVVLGGEVDPAQLSEFEVFPGGAPASVNLARNQPSTASGYTQAFAPANAVDGDASTYWESADNALPQWFQVDLGSSTSVGRIVLDLPPTWTTRTQTITIQGSADGTNYTTLAPSAGYTFDPSTGNTATVTFSAASVRYVKLTFTANTGWPAGQLSELQAYALALGDAGGLVGPLAGLPAAGLALPGSGDSGADRSGVGRFHLAG
jgi:hypothetical protein